MARRSWLDRGLPTEAEDAQSLSGTWACLKTAAALFVIVNLLLLGGRFNQSYSLLPERWHDAGRSCAPVDWLVLGDSSGNCNISPWLIMTELGGTAVNLATVGDTLPLFNAWLANRHVERRGAPRGILLSQVYDVWHRPITTDTIGLYAHLPLRPREWRRLKPNPGFTFGQWRQLFLCHWVPLYGYSLTLRDLVVYPWRRPPQSGSPYDELGWYALPVERAGGAPGDAEGHVRFVKGHRFEVSDVNRAAMDRFVELASTAEVDVYLVNPPTYRGLAEEPAFQAYSRDVQAMLAGLAERSPRVHHDPRAHIFDGPDMENADHLVRPAAERYTREIAAWVRTEPPQARGRATLGPGAPGAGHLPSRSRRSSATTAISADQAPSRR